MEETQLSPKPKNVFVLVLCIITFVFSTYGLVTAIFSYSTANMLENSSEQIEESMDEAMEKLEDNDQLSDNQKDLFQSFFGGLAEAATPENTRHAALLKILCCILCIVGAVFMLQLKKIGFYIYIASIIIMIAGMIAIFGNMIGIVSALSFTISRGVMSILYGVNLKHMK